MTKFKLLATLPVVALLSLSAPGQAQQQPDSHHENQTVGESQAGKPSQAQQDAMMGMMAEMMKMMSGGMMGQPVSGSETAKSPQAQQDMMMSMMASMMKMMGGGMMGQAGQDMQSMDMTQHIEGRIAFLRAELKITDKQAAQWDAFAEALRSNAKGMMDAGMPMMGADATPDLASRFDAQESMLSARLAGVKAMKAALTPLYAALDETQRKTAEELFAAHMGMAVGGMMQGGMGNMTQGGADGMMQGGMMSVPSDSQ